MQRTHILEEKALELSLAGVRLAVRRGPERGRVLRIEREEIVVGTAASCDLVLTDPTVSRSHLALRVLPDGYLVNDLGSTNGTRIEGRRIKSGYVAPGEQIDLGNTRLRLESHKERVDLPLSEAQRFGRMLGRSVASRRLFAMLEKVAVTDATVLILGETGVGKDAAAESIHDASPRRAGPFVVVDCGAITPGLLESELFGHERGAFTGAVTDRLGAFEEANHGTLFLDEIGELPREAQVKLLGALERRRFRRVGGKDPISVDVRVVAATNRDLRVEVNRGTFREDLYHRLNVVAVHIAPLHERPDDVVFLAEHFWRELKRDPQAELSGAVVDDLLAQVWPGNVRQLRNHLEQLMLAPPTPRAIEGEQARRESSFRRAKAANAEAFERRFLAELLERAGGNYSAAARMAEMDRPYLMKLVRKLKLGPSQ